MVSAIDYARRSLVALLKALAKTYGVEDSEGTGCRQGQVQCVQEGLPRGQEQTWRSLEVMTVLVLAFRALLLFFLVRVAKHAIASSLDNDPSHRKTL